MISTLLAEDPILVRILFGVGLVVLAVGGWLLYRFGRARELKVLIALSLIGVLALTVSPSGGRPADFCAVQFSVPFLGVDTLANVALMVPLSLFAALLLRRPLLVSAAAVGFSVLIELVQALIPGLGRSCDTNDWLMNTVGAAVGALIAAAIITLESRRVRTTEH